MDDNKCISCYHWSPTCGTCQIGETPIEDPQNYGCSCYVFFDGEEGGSVYPQPLPDLDMITEQNELEKLALYKLLFDLVHEVFDISEGDDEDPLFDWSYMHLTSILDDLDEKYAYDGGKTLLDALKAKYGRFE